jgi:uncharacterized membrane protein YesL
VINQVLRDKLVEAYVASIPLITLNLVWFITSLPIITLIPATVALFYATNHLAHGRPAGWHTFFEGFRLYFWRSWLWGLLNVLLIAVMVSNFLFYGRSDSNWVIWARALVILLSVFWFTLQIYAYPLLMEQEQPHLRLALRNSLVIVLKRPLHSIGIVLLIGILVVGTTLIIQPAWIVITASLCSFLANQATIAAISRITGRNAASSNGDQED